jgi:hypothetical protein
MGTNTSWRILSLIIMHYSNSFVWLFLGLYISKKNEEYKIKYVLRMDSRITTQINLK